MSKVFPNSRPKLLGEAENSIGVIDTPAVAGLVGNSDTTSGNNLTELNTGILFLGFVPINGPEVISGDITVSNEEVTLIEKTITVPVNSGSLKHSVVVEGSVSLVFDGVSPNFDLRIYENDILQGTVEKFISPTTGTKSFSLPIIRFIQIPDTGSVTYKFTVTSINSPAGFLFVLSFDISAIILTTDDTHDGIIATPATATKQINSPDSHRTHEQEILSD